MISYTFALERPVSTSEITRLLRALEARGYAMAYCRVNSLSWTASGEIYDRGRGLKSLSEAADRVTAEAPAVADGIGASIVKRGSEGLPFDLIVDNEGQTVGLDFHEDDLLGSGRTLDAERLSQIQGYACNILEWFGPAPGLLGQEVDVRCAEVGADWRFWPPAMLARVNEDILSQLRNQAYVCLELSLGSFLGVTPFEVTPAEEPQYAPLNLILDNYFMPLLFHYRVIS